MQSKKMKKVLRNIWCGTKTFLTFNGIFQRAGRAAGTTTRKCVYYHVWKDWGSYSVMKQGNPAFSYRTGFHCIILHYYHYIIASTVLQFLKKFFTASLKLFTASKMLLLYCCFWKSFYCFFEAFTASKMLLLYYYYW